jgi:hypothetical protein
MHNSWDQHAARGAHQIAGREAQREHDQHDEHPGDRRVANTCTRYRKSAPARHSPGARRKPLIFLEEQSAKQNFLFEAV